MNKRQISSHAKCLPYFPDYMITNGPKIYDIVHSPTLFVKYSKISSRFHHSSRLYVHFLVYWISLFLYYFLPSFCFRLTYSFPCFLRYKFRFFEIFLFYVKTFNAINFYLNTALGTSQILVCYVFNFIQLKNINVLVTSSLTHVLFKKCVLNLEFSRCIPLADF